MIPDIDTRIGISVYSTGFGGIGGRIRAKPEDFAVSEALSEAAQESIRESGDYAVYLLKKTRMDTRHAVSDIFKRRGVRLKPLGLKDASAVTVQTVCATRRGRAIADLATDRYSVHAIGYVKRPLSGRDMAANRFKIRITECSAGPDTFEEHGCILNFYGYQRFGSGRPMTHLVGKAILQRDFGQAVRLVLAFSSPYESKDDARLRGELADEANYKRLVEEVPSWMDVEKTVLREMILHGDAHRAVHAIPLPLRRLYVSAYQSYIFNLSLSMACLDGQDLFAARQGDVCYDAGGRIRRYDGRGGMRLAVPFVGYSYYKKTRFDPQISQVLDSEGVAPRDFFIKEMQEVSDQGGFRQAAVQCSDYRADASAVEFSLSRGSFATMVLREIMKPGDPIAAGF